MTPARGRWWCCPSAAHVTSIALAARADQACLRCAAGASNLVRGREPVSVWRPVALPAARRRYRAERPSSCLAAPATNAAHLPAMTTVPLAACAAQQCSAPPRRPLPPPPSSHARLTELLELHVVHGAGRQAAAGRRETAKRSVAAEIGPDAARMASAVAGDGGGVEAGGSTPASWHVPPAAAAASVCASRRVAGGARGNIRARGLRMQGPPASGKASRLLVYLTGRVWIGRIEKTGRSS
jgi:hypothetical protein